MGNRPAPSYDIVCGRRLSHVPSKNDLFENFSENDNRMGNL
jgi:hypothetical protein